jgi:tripartite-type tricarboxylate transporter receptor subunit TctC
MKWKTGLLAGLLAATLTLRGAAAQSYPDRPIRVLVPIAPGSVTDVILRAAAPGLSQRFGQPVVIENRAGGNGVVGAQACANATPDGYTLCAVYHATMSYNPLQFDRLSYDPERDLVPITSLFVLNEVVVVNSRLPVRSVAELRDYARANPGKVNFGTLGGGSLQELMVSWLNNQWGTSILGVPYRGGGPIAVAVSGGEIEIGKMGIGNFIGQIQAGTVRPLAVGMPRRSALLPDVPTFAEAGLAGFTADAWWGLVAPRGTPRSIVDRANREFVAQFADPDFVGFLDKQAVRPQVGTPEEFVAFLRKDRLAAESLVRLSNQPRTEYRPDP